VPIDNMTFSSDGNAGLGKKDASGNIVGFYKAPIDLNLKQVVKLVKEGGLSISDSFRLVTSGPAKNLSLKQKGFLAAGCDADLCFFDNNIQLTDVMAMGSWMMKDGSIIRKGSFE